jgi:hypothetical protein
VSDERVDGGVAPMFFLDFLISLPTHVEENAADGPSDSQDADYGTSRNSGDVGAALFLLLIILARLVVYTLVSDDRVRKIARRT